MDACRFVEEPPLRVHAAERAPKTVSAIFKRHSSTAISCASARSDKAPQSKLGCCKFTTENARDQEKTRTEKQHSAGFWRNSIEGLSRTQSAKLTTHQS